MATLDRIIEMQKQGLSESQVSTQLQNEGISPQEINDSLNQARIKSAVSPPEGMAPPQTGQSQQGAQGTETQQEGMQPSIMQEQAAPGEIHATQNQAEPTREIEPTQTTATDPTPATQMQQMPPEQATMQPPAQPLPVQAPPQQSPEVYPPETQDPYYGQTPQAYSADTYYPPQYSADNETISEIAEQIASEKINEYTKKTGDIASFQNQIQEKVSDIDERLKRIEGGIDKLQQAVIGKIGEFGESTGAIHKDLDNLHGTVSKLMNPLIDNYKELKKISKKS
jgi:hypothetical protein|tara:strand:+ start:437 stop:1282 length:846 start_codon:yes stop_codon:yes gene_type:complete